MKNEKLFEMAFAKVYPAYINKVERKGRSKTELDEVIRWLTGYTQTQLENQIEKGASFQSFFEDAPQMNPNASKVTGVICGWRVEDIANPLLKKIRILDKLIDELAKGKPMEKVLKN